MSQVFELLEKIRQTPGLYLGTASITALRHFLVGYKFARQEMGVLPTDEELDFYQEFQPWLQIYSQVRTANSWDKIILLQSIDEKVAFEYFFRLLAEFRQRDRSQDIDPILVNEAPQQTGKVA
ncbi:MAG: hypothetical protein HC899_21165 [Leptolyngbyaceae cyanobacterium SM1_4_3]|nr:hypothetical protein [Leptolyngbyaceae cyanobacterium SM1_4_3]